MSLLKKEQIVLKENIEDLKNTLSKFTQGRETLDKILKNHNRTFGRVRIGYKPFLKVKIVKNSFVHASSNHSHLTCHFCGTKGYISPSYPVKRNHFAKIKKKCGFLRTFQECQILTFMDPRKHGYQ